MGTCSRCDATRTPGTTFCWQCYAPFPDARPAGVRHGAVATVERERGPYEGRPILTFGRNRPEEGRGIVHIGGIVGPTVIGLMVLMLAGGVRWYLGAQAIEMPSRVGGMTRIEDPPELQQSIASLEEELRAPVSGAMYAQAGVAAIATIAVGAPADYETAEAFLVDGLEHAAPPTLFYRSDRIRSFSSPSGAGLACVATRGIGWATGCAWLDSKTAGFVFTSGERISTARSLALQTYEAVRGA